MIDKPGLSDTFDYIPPDNFRCEAKRPLPYDTGSTPKD